MEGKKLAAAHVKKSENCKNLFIKKVFNPKTGFSLDSA
jgi:hypothetical protein